jgi:hypothetical protein
MLALSLLSRMVYILLLNCYSNIKLILNYFFLSIGCNNCWLKDCSNSIKYEYNHCMGNSDYVNENDWVPTGLQTISTHQYREGDKLVTKHSILEEYETGVQPYYKQPRLNQGIVNDTFEDDNLRFINLGINQPVDEHLRQKL